MPEASVIIVCMNRLDNLYPCLESIRKHTSISYEALVVAYMFSEDNFAKVREDFPWVTFIRSDKYRGFSENNNLALKQAKGRFCFVVNDDTVMKMPVIDRLVEDMAQLPEDAAIISPKLLNADGSLQLLGRDRYPAYKYLLQQWHLWSEAKDNTADKTSIKEGSKIFKVYNVTGAAFLIKTDIFNSLGWFDESYFFTPEDIALSTLANRKGYDVYVDADVSIIHKWRTTASRIMCATRPAAVRGSLIFFADGSKLKYFLLACGVWLAEWSKRFKAAVRYLMDNSPENRTKLQTFRNITRAIFSCKSTKQIFIESLPE